MVDVQDKWLYFLNRSYGLTMIPRALENDAAIVHAFALANRASLSREEADDQITREMYLHDMQSIYQGKPAAEQVWVKEHRAGFEIAHAKRCRNRTLAIARKLLPLLADDVIATATGLTMLEVQALRK